MWFKNVQIFQLKDTENLDTNELVSKIPDFPLKECGSQEEHSFGWLPLIRNSEQWTLAGDRCLLFRAGKEEKVLPAAVVREELEAKVSEIELVEGRKVGRKEKQDMKDELVFTLRPRAFSKRSDIWGYIDLKANILVLNSTNAGMTELLFKHLQTTLGSFPMTPLQAQVSPTSIMTDWLIKNDVPASLETGDECEIQDSSEDKATIRFKSLEPLSEDVTQHLQQGMSVKNVALRWTDKVSFVLHDDLTLRKVKFDDTLKDAAFNDSQGGGLADMDANFALMSLTLRELFDSLSLWFEISSNNE
ncbi:recombination-associated protein RdgC [Marinomonas mediterranea]|jgi:DNA recombination-dependent growth factor C|uniref:Recombination-associated protein RdgC n=1 Tax=Marinomonas mediterranea (strain ATCC 700492 / JCM 21426 / NBRC 103028 / MMB-1) TaxID=717774 RepID=F2K1K5_MARM1|nr:recombination-associated protein RdgC [Marinomonas mediterranea]ADZ92235.1 exonuclease RdgC [Marinomonas mediterranea MMB-1]WCN10192.1 recombination-associated protein RdgC [Marinomonas mediterranea]WCN14236.1 recombination-associated protein RdgC [Marinomonas mediterranea]WCN18293.1 recombination-associated protein RdgC [Marinomonas mediterranea MMB-1]